MKLSQIYLTPKRSVKEYDSVNATLLTKGGFIHQVMAGVYTFLPLGLRVLSKIEGIVKKHMDNIGRELLMSALSPQAYWEQTGRLQTIDILMKTAGANKISNNKNTSEYILNCTHEDNITPLVQSFAPSYKDLPIALYQIQSKFRNEARAKSGLLRCREFRMKDMYSFHPSIEDFQIFYEQMKNVYTDVFKELGIGEKTIVALASGGDFTKEYSHEFQTKSETGEDLIFYSIKTGLYYNKEVAPCLAPDYPQDSLQKTLQKIHTPGAKTMEQLVPMLNVAKNQCVKTILYQTEDGQIVAAAIRGDREVNEIKLSKILNTKLQLATPEQIKKATEAEVGFAGLINLPTSIKLISDNSIEHLVNFESGANQTDYHYINLNWGRDLTKPEQFFDIKVAKDGDLDPENGQVYSNFKACEVGNIFPLGTKFPDAFGFKYTNENGQQKPVYMGSYGIGTSRLMGVIAEISHDEKGVIWPINIAPYTAHLISIGKVDDQAKIFYDQLIKAGIETVWDDRDVSAGIKFAEADLIGCPIRLVISAKTDQKIEWKTRIDQATELISLDEAITRINLAKTALNI